MEHPKPSSDIRRSPKHLYDCGHRSLRAISECLTSGPRCPLVADGWLCGVKPFFTVGIKGPVTLSRYLCSHTHGQSKWLHGPYFLPSKRTVRLIYERTRVVTPLETLQLPLSGALRGNIPLVDEKPTEKVSVVPYFLIMWTEHFITSYCEYAIVWIHRLRL